MPDKQNPKSDYMPDKRNNTVFIVVGVLMLLLVAAFIYYRVRGNPWGPNRDEEDNDNSGGDVTPSDLYSDDSFPLSDGSGGENVRELQNAIIALGGKLPTAGVDGKFGPETESALVDLGYPKAVDKATFDDIVVDAGANPKNDEGWQWNDLWWIPDF